MKKTKQAALETALRAAAEAQQNALDAIRDALDALQELDEDESPTTQLGRIEDEASVVDLNTDYERDRDQRLARLREELKELEQQSHEPSLSLNERARLTEQRAYKAQMIQSIEDEREGAA